jgi:hypothetical protein
MRSTVIPEWLATARMASSRRASRSPRLPRFALNQGVSFFPYCRLLDETGVNSDAGAVLLRSGSALLLKVPQCGVPAPEGQKRRMAPSLSNAPSLEEHNLVCMHDGG